MLHVATRSKPRGGGKEISDFLAQAARTKSRALLLDYDGTLAPFCLDRSHAVPYPAIPPLLEQIRACGDTRLGIVTGRRACEVIALLGIKHLEIWGCHGLERLRADGTYWMPQLDPEALLAMAEADELLAGEGLEELAEYKPAGTAIHWRGRGGMTAEVRGKVERVWSMLTRRDQLRLLIFDGGMEIRVASRNKGDVVRTVLAEMGKGTCVAYLGDDETDEDAFEALRGHGLGVLVKETHRSTQADAWIRPPEGVIGFLNDWIEACGGSP